MKFYTKEIQTVITAVKFIGETVVAGCGGHMLVFKFREGTQDWDRSFSVQIFECQNIHGITYRCLPQIVVFGGKHVALVHFSEEDFKCLKLFERECDDWIVDAKWCSHNVIAVLTAHSRLFKFNFNENSRVQITCQDRCINYCGTIINNDWNDLVALGGTVYNEVIIWSHPQGSVIHRLKGHKGVIFSITWCEETSRICCTSDDRSASLWQVKWKEKSNSDTASCTSMPLWQDASIFKLVSVWGHTARVWASVFLTPLSLFATIGEDGKVIVWNGSGEAVWSAEGSGCSLTCLDVNCSGSVLAVGAADSSIFLYKPSIGNGDGDSVSSSLQSLRIDHLPRQVVLNKEGSPIIYCEGGHLFHGKPSEQNSFDHLYSCDELSSYCIMSASPNRLLIALGSINGHLSICCLGDSGLNLSLRKKVADGKIFSIQWLGNEKILACGSSGQMTLWNLTFLQEGVIDDLTLMKELSLPAAKERWTTCCDLLNNLLIVGDRVGSVYLFDLNRPSVEAASKVYGVHRGRGTSDVCWTDWLNSDVVALSCGRDGTLRHYRLSREQNLKLQLTSTFRMRVDWPAAFIRSPLMGLLLVGFHHVYIEIIGISFNGQGRTLARLKCGGGHRSWDCVLINSASKNEQRIALTFISNKIVHYTKNIILHPAICFKVGNHGRAINDLSVIPLGMNEGNSVDNYLSMDDQFNVAFASGGEDCCVRLHSSSANVSSVQGGGEFLSTSVGKHISSVRGVTSVYCRKDRSTYLFSCGGRSQIKVWSVLDKKSGSIRLAELCSYMARSEEEVSCGVSQSNVPLNEAENRFMAIAAFPSEDTISVVVASSDGSIRKFDLEFNEGIYSLKHSWTLHTPEKCLLTIGTALFNCVDFCQTMIAVGSTSGRCLFYGADQEQICSISNHCGGVNALSLLAIERSDKALDPRGCFLLVATGGDDTKVSLSLIDVIKQTVLHSIIRSRHSAQVTGITLLPQGWAVTAGVDQRVLMWMWTCLTSGGALSVEMFLACEGTTQVADVHGVSVIRSKGDIAVCIYGIGYEVLNIKTKGEPS